MITIHRLIWDPGNVAHIARHGVTPDDVEAVCHGRPIVRQTYDARLILIGSSLAGRILAAVLEPVEPGVYYPVTARPASRRERRLFQEHQDEGSEP